MSVQYRAHVPEDCPPDDAHEASGSVYRMVEGDTPTEEDFLSFRELKPGREYASACIASGLSVYTEAEGIRRLRARVPRFRKKNVAKGTLEAHHGTMKNTPSNLHASHHTWWLARGTTPWSDFEIVTIEDDT